MHRRCLRYYYSFVFNNPPFSPFLRVTLLQTLNTSGKPYHSKILKTLIYAAVALSDAQDASSFFVSLAHHALPYTLLLSLIRKEDNRFQL